MLNIDNFLQTLPISGYGMLGIFIVMAAIYVCIKLLCKILRPKKED